MPTRRLFNSLLAAFAALLLAAGPSLPAYAQSSQTAARFVELAGQLDSRATRDAARAELGQLLLADVNGTIQALASSGVSADGRPLARYALAQIKANELTPLATAMVELALGPRRNEDPVRRGGEASAELAYARGYFAGALEAAFARTGGWMGPRHSAEIKIYALYQEAARLAGEANPSDAIPPAHEHGRVWVRTNLWPALQQAQAGSHTQPRIPVDKVLDSLDNLVIKGVRPNGEAIIELGAGSATWGRYSRGWLRTRKALDGR